MVSPTDKTPKTPATTEDKEAAAAKLKKGTASIMLEEDDEFEDFPADAWEETEDDQVTLNQWEDTWADDDETEDFSVQLQSEMTKRNGAQPMKM
ncbi:uncharacterized protein SPPG_08909 [Spizellomyces punctatus DAOM BR117]|uniref:26S proteasome complex subunit SEM1 n=1 Tax=Spizellomyces punctatus (strain DAOM BR117) TaxID=645134 RepID=A0A0L0HRH2_SPIPD|nr:uncharacterized protein SPPG_08909 [Spizellomyces punctatus DAOM BR117]KND03658.1 hypothetical protein SPPG_08909 [Spizellomyces punctatus DAOM BR117]|eukprot:XP_016611697.1 hypothetical protein SPPG_08909 [Spizellomyces punctatus DAOM BR117]